MHAAACKGVVAADEELAVVVILGANAHVAVNRFGNVLNVFEGSNGRSSRLRANRQHYSRHAAKDCVLLNGGEVGSTASIFRCKAMVADRVAIPADAYYAVREFYCWRCPIIRNGKGYGLCRSC